MGEPGQQGFVQLNGVYAYLREREDLVAQDRNTSAGETLPGGIGFRRVLRMPKEIANRAGSGQGDDNFAIRVPAQEFCFIADDGAVALELIHDEGVQQQRAALGFLASEASHLIGKYASVVLAAILAVGDVVEARRLLHQNRRQRCRIEELVGLRFGQAAGDSVSNDILHPSRTGQTADYHRGEKGVLAGCGHRSAVLRLQWRRIVR